MAVDPDAQVLIDALAKRIADLEKKPAQSFSFPKSIVLMDDADNPMAVWDLRAT